ncbi:MAG: hypothetical protein JO202_12120 [Ktedonobacteraceae bacterium]|nr:hypothetical protein [Ktedonobacteraceae bacterium]
MQYLRNQILSDDEVDALFDQLQPMEPPEWLVQSILAAVSQLPRPSLVEGDYTGLVVRNNGAGPS